MAIKKFDPWSSYSLTARLLFLAIFYSFGFMAMALVMRYFGATPRYDGIVGGFFAIALINTLDTLRPEWHPAIRVVLSITIGVVAALLVQALFR